MVLKDMIFSASNHCFLQKLIKEWVLEQLNYWPLNKVGIKSTFWATGVDYNRL